MNYKERLSKDSRITILALSWRDIKSPTAGGAEVHTHELLKRLDANKFRVVHFAAFYKGLVSNEEICRVNYIRKGNIFSVIWFAFLYYIKNRRNIDFVIEQCNTHRFVTPFWVNKNKRIFYIHQLTREIWDINLKFPWNTIGKMLESIMLKINRRDYTITVSASTRNDLIAVGFDKEKIKIIPNGINFKPWEKDDMFKKEENLTFIYVGRYAFYKGIDVAIEALGKIKKEYKNSKLWILGKKDEEYVNEKLQPICEKYGLIWEDGNLDADIISWGFVSEEKKLELISKATALVFPSIREGWGIPITEAAYVGTPSIVFDAPGVRDAVNEGKSGYLCKVNNADGLEEMMVLVAKNKELYLQMQDSAYEFSKDLQWDKVGDALGKFIEKIMIT